MADHDGVAGSVMSFSLTEGGPFCRLLYRLHVRTREGKQRYWWLGFVLWLPLAMGAAVQHGLAMPRDPLVFDFSVHVRLLVAVPVMLYGEHLLDQAARRATESLYAGAFCDAAKLDRILERAERKRDSWRAELVILALAIFGGQLALWQVLGPAGWIHGSTTVSFWSFPRVWYALVGLPVFQFVLLRWLWRWLIWSYVVVRISRVPLFVLGTHPDQSGGLLCLSWPTAGFAVFAFANSAVMAGAWATQLIAGRITLTHLAPLIGAEVLVVLVLALAPLLPVSLPLFRARRLTLAEYSDFARQYVLAFHARWITHSGDGQQALGSSDIQSLADLANSFAVAAKTRVFAFAPRTILVLAVAAVLPMLPLYASAFTFEQLVQRIAKTVVGGFAR